jgi:hypothetical protein
MKKDEKYSEKDALLGLFYNIFIIYKMKKFFIYGYKIK